MPKIPQFEPQTRVTAEGPSTLVDANTYGIEGRGQAALLKDESSMWGSVADAGTKLEAAGVHFAKVGQQIQHAQDVAGVSKAIGQSYLQLGNEKIKNQSDPSYINVTDDKGNTRPRTWQETQAFALENTNKIKQSLMEGLSDSGKQLFEGHFDRLAAESITHMTGEAQQRQIRGIAADFKGSLEDAVQGEALGNSPPGTVDMILNGAASTGVISPKEIERARKDAYNKIDITRGQNLAASNPGQFIEGLKDPTFLPTVIGNQRKALETYAFTEKNRQQNQLWDEVQQGFAKGVPPTQDQLSGLSGGHQLTVKHLMKSMADEDNKPTVVAFGDKVIRLSQDQPDIEKSGTALYNEIANASGLSTSTKLNFMNTVMSKVKGAQLSDSKFQDQYLLGFSKLMTPDQHKLFMIDYGSQPKGVKALPPNASTADKMKNMNEFALPYINSSRNDIEISLGKKNKKGGSMEGDQLLFGGGGGAHPTSAGTEATVFRPGRYQLPDGSVKSIKTKAEYDKYNVTPRAAGGPVDAGESYVVGEKGAEVLIEDGKAPKVVGKDGPQVIEPKKSGVIIPSHAIDEFTKGLQEIATPKKGNFVIPMKAYNAFIDDLKKVASGSGFDATTETIREAVQ